MDVEHPPAGWYEDPLRGGQQRYYDGTAWTELVRPADPAFTTGPHDDAPTARPDPSYLRADEPTVEGRGIDPTETLSTVSAASAVEPGWYDDPTGSADQRYHDGQAWTGSTRGTPQPGYPAGGSGPGTRRRRPVGAFVAVGTLALAAVAVVVGVTVLTGDDPSTIDEARADASDGIDDQTGETAGVDDDPTNEPAEEGDDASLTEPDSPEDGAGGTEQDGDEAVTEDSSGADEQLLVDLDGVCEAVVPLEELERGSVRAWDVGCTTAPVALNRDESRWIVVVASLNGEDFTEDAAHDRADSLGLPDRVLWSSHYPSLNPDLWVVFDGPFSTEQAASDAALSRGDTSYPRVLSDDDGDRYCIAADGCQGERNDAGS